MPEKEKQDSQKDIDKTELEEHLEKIVSEERMEKDQDSLEKGGEERREGESNEERIEKPVVIKAEAYKTIILYASRYANKSIPKEEWKEIYGILVGYSDKDYVYVERAEGLTFGHSTDVQLDERHYVFIDEIQQKLDKEKKDFYIIGWFHSHPGLGLFFSYIDLINQLGFQAKNPDFCGLVFDHTLLGKKKKEKVEGTAHSITKYDTGFEIYRISDVNLDVDSPEFDNNYHKVEYIIDGLNKFFFANVLSELSALVTAGKPLQSAYGEDIKLESNYRGETESQGMTEEKKKTSDSNNPHGIKEDLEEIPLSEDILFNVDEVYYDNNKQKESSRREKAEEYIYEGKQAFKKRDVFSGVEKFRQGIKILEEINDHQRILEILKELIEECLYSDHLVLAEEFTEKLNSLATNLNIPFYLGEANYLKGQVLLKKKKEETLTKGLENIQKAAVILEKEGDFVGAGTAFYKIGSIYQNRLNMNENSCLFYREAIENYNKAIVKNHPLRKSMWSKPELLKQKIIELKELIEQLLPTFTDMKLKQKVVNDLNSISYNF
ncbi:MAG: hypothetical protein BAJALOKI2v1_260017 [Promethearchaeota archaeon]|nr:MAG: hypothetical protein BAJALOKI2v1_260017 [Candidatus Lokiarchaeota archaeon]